MLDVKSQIPANTRGILREHGTGFCAVLCQLCAVEFLRAVGNPRRNSSNPLRNNGFRPNGLEMICKA